MIKIFIVSNKKRLLKLAYSTNDHTIPNNICIDEINNKEGSDRLLNLLDNNSSIIPYSTTQNIQAFNFILKYEFDANAIGLYCLTGKKDNTIGKFEFYVQKLSKKSEDDAHNAVVDYCKKRHFMGHQTKKYLQKLQRYLNTNMYKINIVLHNSQYPYDSLLNRPYTYIVSKNTKFTNNLICTYIKEIMQKENFIQINE